MSCCIGGVCIPYTAIVPLLLLGVKWIAEKLASIGILPAPLADKLGLMTSQHNNNKSRDCCIDGTEHTTKTIASSSSSSLQSLLDNPGESKVRKVESLEALRDILQEQQQQTLNGNKKSLIVVKFTATWCKPCQDIAPVFGALSAKYDNVVFCEVDVDEVDEVASKYKVSLMPTIVWIDAMADEKEVGRMTGSNVAQLEMAMAKYCSYE
jgi:thiol-disulfide isomerase/thioredoxin